MGISIEWRTIFGRVTCIEQSVSAEAIKQVQEYFTLSRTAFSVDLLLKGTEFQKSVWKEIQKIPYGQTRTYKQIAQAIGRPMAHRAVANACGANPFPIIIPCHRVTGSSGYIGGYAYGIKRKKSLLALERSFS